MIKAKIYLEEIGKTDERINLRIRQLDDLKLKATAVGGFSYDRDKIKTSGSGDRMAEDVTAYVELENKINREIDAYINLKDRIIEQISRMSDRRYIRILGSRYVEQKSLARIAKEMHYEYGTIRNLHGIALLEFDRRYEQEIRRYLDKSNDTK